MVILPAEARARVDAGLTPNLCSLNLGDELKKPDSVLLHVMWITNRCQLAIPPGV